MELDHASNKEQVEFMTKRNATLGKKCEELVEKNRAIQNEWVLQNFESSSFWKFYF